MPKKPLKGRIEFAAFGRYWMRTHGRRKEALHLEVGVDHRDRLAYQEWRKFEITMRDSCRRIIVVYANRQCYFPEK